MAICKGVIVKSEIREFVKGIPKAQPRPRLARNGHVYNPDSADAWKDEIKIAFMRYRNKQTTKPIHLRVYFFMPVPKGKKTESKNGQYVPHVKKPDTDNLLKATMDAITEVGVWKDDAQVFWAEGVKWYASDTTGAEIVIEVWS